MSGSFAIGPRLYCGRIRFNWVNARLMWRHGARTVWLVVIAINRKNSHAIIQFWLPIRNGHYKTGSFKEFLMVYHSSVHAMAYRDIGLGSEAGDSMWLSLKVQSAWERPYNIMERINEWHRLQGQETIWRKAQGGPFQLFSALCWEIRRLKSFSTHYRSSIVGYEVKQQCDLEQELHLCKNCQYKESYIDEAVKFQRNFRWCTNIWIFTISRVNF